MKKLSFLLFLLLFSTIVFSHGLTESKQLIKKENYSISFVIVPDFPIVGQKTHLGLIIFDSEKNLLDDLKVEVELHKQGFEKILLEKKAEFEGNGEYAIEFTFNEPGTYELHANFELEGKEIEEEFIFTVESFQFRDWISISIILMILLVLLFFTVKEYFTK